MKTKLLVFALLFLFANSTFSNENYKNTISKAEEFKLKQKYSKAIKYYVKAAKLERGNNAKIKLIYFDIADCFYKSGKKNMAIKVLKFSIYRYGAVKEDFINTSILDKDFSNLILSLIEDKYAIYRSRYVDKFEKEILTSK